MARKERNQEVVISAEPNEQKVENELLFEAEAYGSPQPEAGSDVTVMKQVGIGGPVPIVAPKHNTIQLQPIVVPLAVVPYMTQDSNVLRTDSRQVGGVDVDEYMESTQFESVGQQKKTRRKINVLPRIFAFVSLLLSAAVLLPFLVSYTNSSLGTADIAAFNIIGIIKGWVENSFSWTPATNLIYIAIACLAAVQTLLSLIGCIIGKYPKPIVPIFSFIVMGCMIGVLVAELVGKTFVTAEQVGFLAILVLSILGFLASVVFSIVLNRRDDRADMEKRRRSEI